MAYPRTKEEQEIMNRYPHLFIFCSQNLIHMWVANEYMGEIRDTTSIPDPLPLHAYQSNNQETIQKLEYYNEEARKSKQEGWFLCTGHRKAEPMENFSFFHCAGWYCKEWAALYPKQRLAAIQESYD